MDTGTISPYSGKKYKPVILSSGMISVEVFILFITNSRQAFTVNDLINLFYIRYKILLEFRRMQQICQELSNAGKVSVNRAINKKNREVNYYSFNTIL